MAYELRKSDENVFIADTAVVGGDVTLGKGVSVWFQAVVRGDEGPITVGENSNVQDGAILHSETRIGKNCTIGHGAIVHGCTVGDDTLIGMGAIVLNGARIGKNCIIGAGAPVTQGTDIPDGSLAFGSPAKVVRPLTDEEIAENHRNAMHYVEIARESLV